MASSYCYHRHGPMCMKTKVNLGLISMCGPARSDVHWRLRISSLLALFVTLTDWMCKLVWWFVLSVSTELIIISINGSSIKHQSFPSRSSGQCPLLSCACCGQQCLPHHEKRNHTAVKKPIGPYFISKKETFLDLGKQICFFWWVVKKSEQIP